MNSELQKIIDAIKTWNNLISKREIDPIQKALEQGDCFFYRIKDIDNSNSVHAYPGIEDGKLIFFAIPSEFDCEKYKDQIEQYVETCHIIKNGQNSNQITDEEAKKRINNWLENYLEWISNQSKTSEGIFRAFVIPTDDDLLSTERVAVYLALKNIDSSIKYSADLIIEKLSETYYDTVRPVPPFAPSDSFYLLDLAQQG